MFISVVMATYNGERFIAQQLRSILNQLDSNSEVVISDNNSTDATTDIICSFNDKRIKLYSYPEKGVIRNFENALRHASGEVIFLADQDDVWLENKIEITVKYFENYDLVMSDSFVVDENLSVMNDSFYRLTGAGRGLMKNLLRNTYQGSNMAFKKELLQIVLPFPSKIPMHDIWISFVGELFYKTFFIPEKLSLYRRHGTNASSSTNKSPYSLLRKLKFRFWLIQQTPALIYKKLFGIR